MQQFLNDIDALLPTLGTKPHLVVLASQVRRQAACAAQHCAYLQHGAQVLHERLHPGQRQHWQAAICLNAVATQMIL